MNEKMNPMKRYIVLCMALLLPLCLFSGTVWQENIRPVGKSGYYHILLGQKLVGRSGVRALSDLRILDAKDNEISYFLRAVNPVEEARRWEDYPLLQNRVRDSLNIVIVDNTKEEYINRFYLVVRKAEVSKSVSLRGSNDLKQWYVVKKKTGVSGFGDTDETLILDFPKGNYRYYEITLENTQRSPLEVLKVGKIENSSIYAQFEGLDVGRFSRVDSTDKKTYVSFPDLQDIYCIGRLEVYVGNHAYYLRRAVMADSVSGGYAAFELSAKWNNTFFVDDFVLSRHTSIIIENNSNPPLIIDSVRVYGLNRYACAYLEEGQVYRVQVGGDNRLAPEYDIRHFQTDIPSELPVIETDSLIEIPGTASLSGRELFWLEKPIFLWGTIIVIGLFLLLICVRMMKQMKSSK